MSYYKRKVRSSIGQDDSFVQGEEVKKGSGGRALCATCGHKFERGERVYWRSHFSPSKLYAPVKVGVCSTCQRDPTFDEAEFHAERQPTRKH